MIGSDGKSTSKSEIWEGTFPLSSLSKNLRMSPNCCIKGLVFKETVVLRRWESSIQKFGLINGADNVNWPPYRDSKS